MGRMKGPHETSRPDTPSRSFGASKGFAFPLSHGVITQMSVKYESDLKRIK